MTYEIKPLRWHKWNEKTPNTHYARTIHGTFYIVHYGGVCSVEVPSEYGYKQFVEKRTVEQAKRYCQRVHDRVAKKWLRRKA